MPSNYKNRLDRIETMLEFLQLAYTRCKDLFHEECHYYVYINQDNEVEIIVKRPGLNQAALTWKHSDVIFSGDNSELCEYLESLQTKNNVVKLHR